MKNDNTPYLEHSKMMNRLVKLSHFCPISYLAITLLEEMGNSNPSITEIKTTEARIKTSLSLNDASYLEHSLMMECWTELTHCCSINYLAIALLEEAGNLNPSMAEIETMEIRVKISFARVGETYLKKIVTFLRAKSA